MSDVKPIPAIVLNAKIQTPKDAETLVRGGKARIATAKDCAIAGVAIDPKSLAAGAALQDILEAEAAANAAQSAADKSKKTKA